MTTQTKPRVDFIYEASCPNITAARKQLLKAFAACGLAPVWREWESSRNDLPRYAQGYGSPTILVDGKDVVNQAQDDNDQCCRIYNDKQGQLRGTPTVAAISLALSQSGAKTKSAGKNNFRQGGAAYAWLPSLGIVFLPKLSCPACWPAYAAVMSSMGLGFAINSQWLLSLTVVFLLIALAALFYRAPERRGYRPFVLASLAAIALLIAKFQLENNVLMYSAIAVFLGAGIWNAWPKSMGQQALCPHCPNNGVTSKSNTTQ